MKIALLSLLVLLSLSFAAPLIIPPVILPSANWQTPAILAAFAALGVLLILYLLGFFFDSAEMRTLARQDMWQVFVTMFFIVFFIALEAYSSSTLSSAFSDVFGGAVGNHVDFALKVSQDLSDKQWESLSALSKSLTIPLGSMASASGTCNIMGSSFSYTGCGGIQVPFASLTFATNALVSAMLVNNSQTFLIQLASSFFFPVLLPIGLFFRCFQFTRGAGGLLIAIAVGFYFIYPFSVILTWGMAKKAADTAGIPAYGPEAGDYPSFDYPVEMFAKSFDTFEIKSECNPLDMDPKAARHESERLTGDSGDSLVDPLVYQFFIEGLFTTMLNLLITLTAIRGLASIFGAEVDISGLARIS